MSRHMPFFSPLRSLLYGWLLSFLGWMLVAFAISAYGVTTRGDAWSFHLEPSLREWLPWAVFTPLLFRLVARLPIDRAHWKLAIPGHVLACVGVLLINHWWKDTFHLRGPVMDWVSGTPDRGMGWNSWGLGPGPGLMGEPPRGFPDQRGPRDPGGPPPGRFDGPPPDFFGDERPGPPPERGAFGRRPDFPDHPPGPRGGRPPGPPPNRQFEMVRFMTFELPLYLMILTGAHAALFFRREQERATSLARARLDSLRMQLQPHFLFNTLNTIAGLVHEDPDKADAMLTALSDLLRLTLETSSEQELPLQRELEFVERYFAIMHARFEEKLRYEIDVVPETRAALVPNFILQPIVENAVQHGLEPKPDGGLVTVRTWREGDMLHIAVKDNGVGLSQATEQREGIGLGNTRTRLRELYGERARLNLESGDGTTVEITLPFRTAAGSEKTVS